jgi:hypothetical protein
MLSIQNTSTVFLNSGTLDEDLIKNSFFKFYDSHIVIKIKEEIKIFRIDEISNVRFSKKRNFTINIILLFITLFIYCFLSDFLNKNFIYNVLLIIIAVISSVVSLSIKNHKYTLFININYFGFRELKISKKESPYAEYFVSIFNTKYVKKKKQNDLDFVNFKHSP